MPEITAELEVDEERLKKWPEDQPWTGIYIRAKCGEKWGSYDLLQLSRASVLAWLTMQAERGGDRFLKSTILALLGHEHTEGF